MKLELEALRQQPLEGNGNWYSYKSSGFEAKQKSNTNCELLDYIMIRPWVRSLASCKMT